MSHEIAQSFLPVIPSPTLFFALLGSSFLDSRHIFPIEEILMEIFELRPSSHLSCDLFGRPFI